MNTGFWGIPAYTMQGLNAEVNKMFARSLQNYIIASRVSQGKGDMDNANPEEKDDVVARWQAAHEELRPFFDMKKPRHHRHHSHGKGKGRDESVSASSESKPSKTGFWNTRHLSFDERKKLHAQKDALKKGSNPSTPTTASDTKSADVGSVYSTSSEDTELEQAIADSVKETSRGNPEEDIMVEAAIRASIKAMRENGVGIPQPEQVQVPPEKDPSLFKDPEYQISDEQYQELIEQALQKSMAGHTSQGTGTVAEHDDDDDVDLKRAIEASKADAQNQSSQRNEEDIVMEYVKKQSLAEEELRKKQVASGKSHEGGGGVDEEHDEDLRRAMEESLKMSGGGPSGA